MIKTNLTPCNMWEDGRVCGRKRQFQVRPFPRERRRLIKRRGRSDLAAASSSSSVGGGGGRGGEAARRNEKGSEVRSFVRSAVPLFFFLRLLFAQSSSFYFLRGGGFCPRRRRRRRIEQVMQSEATRQKLREHVRRAAQDVCRRKFPNSGPSLMAHCLQLWDIWRNVVKFRT